MDKRLVMIKDKIKKVFLKIFKNKKTETWKDIEYFDESWIKRIKEMSGFITPSESVMDLGCGQMWLSSFLDASNKYYPVDYTYRSDNTIIADFNKNQFPDLNVDVVFASGILEYIDNPKWFVKKISDCCKKCIISYCTIEYHPSIRNRRNLKWVNDLTFKDIENLFKENNMILENNLLLDTNSTIFIFKKLCL
jgi:2-polyprenyl-3-methyl-5-hydroxy-6-metoxy-1,4-benzoquinol methylase